MLARTRVVAEPYALQLQKNADMARVDTEPAQRVRTKANFE